MFPPHTLTVTTEFLTMFWMLSKPMLSTAIISESPKLVNNNSSTQFTVPVWRYGG